MLLNCLLANVIEYIEKFHFRNFALFIRLTIIEFVRSRQSVREEIFCLTRTVIVPAGLCGTGSPN